MTRPAAIRGACLALALLGSTASSHAGLAAHDGASLPRSAAEQDGTAPREESELDKLVRVARTGRPAFRPQAARRLVDRGAPAAERLLAECGETNSDLAALGTALVEVLAEFDEPRLRAKAWSAVDDRDFPWRPAAARGLAVRPELSEATRFTELVRDPIAPVRHAAVLALRALAASESTDEPAGEFDAASVLRVRLADPDDRVRRAAAAGLADLGRKSALWWIASDLERNDKFFDRPDGKIARYDAVRELEERNVDLHGYDAELPPAGNADALAAIRADLVQSAGEPPELPVVARPSTESIDAVLGLELRSCRKGEIFLRWSTGDVLWVGAGNPARVELPEGTVRGLVEAAREQLPALGDRHFWGEAGCDMEQFQMRLAPGAGTTTFVLAKGPDAIEDLRPEPLTRLAARLADSLPDTADSDERVALLRRRALATLAALGGPLE